MVPILKWYLFYYLLWGIGCVYKPVRSGFATSISQMYELVCMIIIKIFVFSALICLYLYPAPQMVRCMWLRWRGELMPGRSMTRLRSRGKRQDLLLPSQSKFCLIPSPPGLAFGRIPVCSHPLKIAKGCLIFSSHLTQQTCCFEN